MATPLTPFETSGGTQNTTYEEGELFIDTVISTSLMMRKVEIGRSSQGLPITAVVIGSPTPPSWPDLVDSVVIVASQHGFETRPREAALQLIRNIAYSEDPQDGDRLGVTPLVIIPTANPDGAVANTRTNGAGVDLNRDHLALTQPETQAIASVITAGRAAFVLDAHEASTAGYQVSGGYFATGASEKIKQFAPYIADAMEDILHDYTYGEYDWTDHEGTLQGATSLRGIPVLLTETLNSQGALVQAEQHLRSMIGMYRFVSDSGGAFSAVRDAAMDQYRQDGINAYIPHYGYESGTIPARRGYWVPQGTDLRVLRLLGIKYIDDPSSTPGAIYVSMGQSASGIVPLLLDPEAPRPVAQGEPIGHLMGFSEGLPEGFSPPGIVTQLNGGRQSALQLVVQLNGVRSVVWGTFV